MEILLLLSMTIGFLCHIFWEKYRKLAIAQSLTQIKRETFSQLRSITQSTENKLAEEKKLHLSAYSHYRQENLQYLDYLRAKLRNKEKDRNHQLAQLSQTKEKLTYHQQQLAQKEQQKQQTLAKLQQLQEEYLKKLLAVSNTCKDKLKKQISQNLHLLLQQEQENFLVKKSLLLQDKGLLLAKNILSIIIQRCQLSHWAESSNNLLQWEKQDIPRLQELQNALDKTMHQELGVKIFYDWANAQLTIAEGDGCTREVAKRALQELAQSSETTPEHAISHQQQQFLQEITTAGYQACTQVGEDQLPEHVMQLFGRLKYRTSFGQNILGHSIEVAFLSGLLAYELRLDGKSARQAGFFHDIGKSLDQEEKGDHTEIGINVIKNLSVSAATREAVAHHHNGGQAHTPYATITIIGDAISAARPSARRGTLEKYVNKLETLEEIAHNIPEVIEAYAISAGRELRVMVHPQRVPEKKLSHIARQIARKIEQRLVYPGKITIVVIREFKANKTVS